MAQIYPESDHYIGGKRSGVFTMTAQANLRQTSFLLAAILAAGTMLSACSILGESDRAERKLHIHVQTWFDDTPVEIKLNGETVLDERVSTGGILAVAARISRMTPERSNNLYVRVDNEATADTTLVVHDSLYVGINYSQDRVGFKTQEEPFAYY